MNDDECRAAAQAPRRRKPRKVTPRALENAALHYLKRYSTSVQQLRRVLSRRIDRSLREHGGDKAEALRWLDALVEKLLRSGLVGDEAYAGTKAHALRAAGKSARAIGQKLRAKGVAGELVAQKLAEVTAELPEEKAALIWARKRRLGPFRRPGENRQERRTRDLAALARAGFSFQVAKKVIDGDGDAADESGEPPAFSGSSSER